jgi:hypothetical protein
VEECEWFLLAFDKNTEELAGEYAFVGLDAATVGAIFGVPADIARYGSVPVGREHIDQLHRYTNAELDLQKYDYFVDCFAT